MNTPTPTNTLRILALATLSISTFTMLAGCSDTDSSTDSAATDSHADHDHGENEGHDHDAEQTAEQVIDLAGNKADDHSGHDHADTSTSPAATPHIYPGILGEITMLPIAGNPATDLKIHHQHIPSFKSADGSIKTNSKGIAGMMSMTMPFPLADGVDTDGLSIGDKIRFTFQVIWTDTRPSWEVTQINKIDPSTEIDFTNAIAP